MKKEHSIIQIVTGFAAAAAVIGLVAGSVVLIASQRKNNDLLKPGQSGSEASVTEQTTAATTEAVQTTTAPAVPDGSNFLGGKGELVCCGSNGEAGYKRSGIVLKDDENWYFDSHSSLSYVSMPIGGGSYTPLDAEQVRAMEGLLYDGTSLYRSAYNDNVLYSVDSKGSTAPFYTYKGDGTVYSYNKVLYLDTMKDGGDPWYYIGALVKTSKEGYTQLAIAYQPAAGKEIDLAQFFKTDGIELASPEDVNYRRFNGACLIGKLADNRTFVSIPHPDVITDPLTDWASTVRKVDIPDTSYIDKWCVSNDTINFVVQPRNPAEKQTVCRLWADGALETFAADTDSERAVCIEFAHGDVYKLMRDPFDYDAAQSNTFRYRIVKGWVPDTQTEIKKFDKELAAQFSLTAIDDSIVFACCDSQFAPVIECVYSMDNP